MSVDDEIDTECDHVWMVIEESPAGVIVECYDCGAELDADPEPVVKASGGQR